MATEYVAMKDLKFILDEKVEAILSELPENGMQAFDTHDFIRVFMNIAEMSYADGFVRFKECKTPFAAFHGCIARYLNTLEKRGLIEKEMEDGKKKRVATLNIKGNRTSNQVWRKR